MWKESSIYWEDLQNITCNSSVPWSELDGKNLLVTGGTGLIGSHIINTLLYYGLNCKNPPKVFALVRNMQKARQMFSQQSAECGDRIVFIQGDLRKKLTLDNHFDYIIHAASETASAKFIGEPVETIETAVNGTMTLLRLARDQKVKSFVYLSSMEAYGSPQTGELLSEDAPAYFSSTAIRSCYPESKRMCEVLCAAFASEYGVPAKMVRLAQTFGPGISADDKRIFASLVKCAISGNDIKLATKGRSERMYLYTSDAVSAILSVLLKGQSGECYNAANPDTYCSILEMAEMVANKFSNPRVHIVVLNDADLNKKYPAEHKLKLDTSKIERLGWKATTGLQDMYARMIEATWGKRA